MFGIFKKKRKFKKTDFTKRRTVNNEYEYYNPSLNQWLSWSIISSDTEFTNEAELLNTTLLDLENPNTEIPLNTLDCNIRELSLNNNLHSSSSYSSGLSHSSSSSPSSHDSCSSSSPSSGSDSGGCF